ncbi:hypothetical protein GGI15_003055 [Coemansia interrupta]|uniref:Uncharacterized protein n=1 Tax=Coemansia interrupta TaxID=1126814 RepID=A0A9W8H9F4_9FUNG|nr:hypothetical protein GGI15_003055 [Coemansia interrupta]
MASTSATAPQISASTVREAFDQVLVLLGTIHSQLGATSAVSEDSQKKQMTSKTVSIDWYVEKCEELKTMTRMYKEKCRDHEELLIKYTQLQTKEQQHTVGGLTRTAAAAAAAATKKHTFDELDKLEKEMLGSRRIKSHRSNTATSLVSPTKRARRELNLTSSGMMKPLSSPPPTKAESSAASVTKHKPSVHRQQQQQQQQQHANHHGQSSHKPKTTTHLVLKNQRSPPGVRRLSIVKSTVPSAPPAPKPTHHLIPPPNAARLDSSQETRLDFSDPLGPLEDVLELCPESDSENIAGDNKVETSKPPSLSCLLEMEERRKVEEANKSIESAEDAETRRRILEAVKDCQTCTTFYSVRGLVLPKRDPGTLCVHKKSKGKAARRSMVNMTPIACGPKDGWRQMSPPRSEQRRPSTPEHYWDLGHFPDIRTAGVPLCAGMGLAFSALRPSAAGWHNRLRKPKYNIEHRMLMPLFAAIYTLQGLAAYLATNEMMLAQRTSETIATRAGQLGLGFYWLGLTFLVFWPPIIGYESSHSPGHGHGHGWALKLAMVDMAVALGFQFLAMVQFFRLTAVGGLIMLLVFFAMKALGVWNAALVQKSGYLLPL